MKGLSPVGRVGKLFGLDGGVTVNFHDVSPGDINLEEPLYVVIDMLAVPLFIEHFERRGRNGALVRFADIDNQTRAEELIGAELYQKEAGTADGDTEAPYDELYFEDLVGYAAVVREEGSDKPLRGEITGYLDSDMNPLLTVSIGGDEIFIPANDDLIASVDTESGMIEFILPEGFLELYL